MLPARHAVIAATVFDGETALRESAVLIEGRRIVWVGPRQTLSPSIPAHVLPGDAWLVPGFIDVQVNGGDDLLFNAEPSHSTLSRMAAAHRTFGTTAILPTLITDTRETMRAGLAAVRATSVDSGILGIHLEGPFLSPEKPGVHDVGMMRAPDAEDFELLSSLLPGPTLVTLAPERVPAGFIGRLVAAGVRVSLGHSMATYAQTRLALDEGLSGFTHLFNAMRPLGSREPGPIAAALESSAWFGMIADGVHVDAAMLRLALRGSASPMLVTDAMPPVGGRLTHFTLNGRRIEVRGTCCVRDDGALAGTALDMASAVRNCVRLLGVPLPLALRYASSEPARFLGVDHDRGRLKTGLRADMVALEPGALRVLGTWLGGKWQAATTESPLQLK
jgi:N-acetylglucosamine-6-phosphate deacetylase